MKTQYTIKPITDFDENRSIIAWLLEHPAIGEKGLIFTNYFNAELFIHKNINIFYGKSKEVQS